MQGYKNWATFLNNLLLPVNVNIFNDIAGKSWKSVVIPVGTTVETTVENIIINSPLFPKKVGDSFDKGDSQLWDNRYREGIKSGLPLERILFFKLGEYGENECPSMYEAAGCPHDCVHKSILDKIALHIINNSANDAKTKMQNDKVIQEYLDSDACHNKASRRDQYEKIKIRVSYYAGLVPMLSILPWKSNERALFLDLKENPALLDE